MPEESKKNKQKGKNDPKEQRRPRQRQAGSSEQKTHKNTDEKVKVPSKPVYEEPGPEFYNSLKRETDEILKITEEENSKYKKKEIQSNWSKYEMQLETYDEIDEQENLGADYEKLIEAPLSIGGHFQFKHEKSWDIDIGPSPYDKYFEIDMDNLYLAISTLPLYERNNISKEFLHDTDILNMDNKAKRLKAKYYNLKSVDPTTEHTQSIIMDMLRSSKATQKVDSNDEDDEKGNDNICTELSTENHEINEGIDSISLEQTSVSLLRETESPSDPETTEQINQIDNIYDFLSESTLNANKLFEPSSIEPINKTKDVPVNQALPKTSVIESHDDLEKWLDDFLDG